MILNHDLTEKLDLYFSEVETEFVKTISDWVAVKSIKGDAVPGKPFGEGPAEALALALKTGENAGFLVKNHENYVGTLDLNEKETRLGMLCHLDVVEEGPEWQTDPFQAVINEGMIYGRGTSDDKGPAVAALFAMKAIKHLGIPLKYNVRLILGTDEESDCKDIDYYFQKESPPPFTFSPDGDFPVLNTEKGGLRPKLSKTWQEERQSPQVTRVSGGNRINVIPAQAQAFIEGIRMTELISLSTQVAQSSRTTIDLVQQERAIQIIVNGKSDHAATPQNGCNPNTAILELLAMLPLAESETTNVIRALHAFFPHQDYYGNALGINQVDEISGPTTVSLNILDITTQGFTAWFDSRTALNATKENTEDIVREKMEKKGITMEGTLSAPHHTPGDSEFVKTLLAAYEHYTGKEGYCESTGGGTYVHGIDGGVCFGPNMPGFKPNAHGPDEHTSIQDLITAAKIYAQVIVEICA